LSIAAHTLTLPRRERDESSVVPLLAWLVFILLNATLFLRPAEIVPEWQGLPIYYVIILACLALALPAVLAQLNVYCLAETPITLCVIAMLPAVVLSRLARGDVWYARTLGAEFFKVVLYYLLLVALVNSSRRLQQFLICIAAFALGLTCISLLRYHGVIHLDTITPMEEKQRLDATTGGPGVMVRLQAAGIYANPNDLARIIVVGITVCLFALARRRPLLLRLPWLAPLGVFAYGLRLTYSRGGLLALAAGLLVLFHARYGLKKGIAAAVIVMPAMMFFAGRQTDISTSKDTGQERIKLWSHGLVALRSSPVIGTGANTYFKIAGNHAHNSFLEAWVETGVFGGTAFIGAFYLAATGLYRLKPRGIETRDPELWRARPYLLSIVVGSIVAQLSSSREYSLPTYMILGVATAYLGLAARHSPSAAVPLSFAMMRRLLAVGVAALVVFHFYAKFTARF
jgi:hypothetical protein